MISHIDEVSTILTDVRAILRDAQRVVFFGGAGISTDSGIPDFRGGQGLYDNQPEGFTDPPEYLLSRRCLSSEPEKFFRYYREHMLYPAAKPNAAHLALAELERQGKLKAVVTQNIDGLHQAAGSRNVLELHGTTAVNYCVRCKKRFDGKAVTSVPGVPRCECGGMIRPDVVLYGEGLDGDVFDRAERAIADADVLIVGGTSLTVYPAASLVELFCGEHLIIINKTETRYDGLAEYIFRQSLSEVLPLLI